MFFVLGGNMSFISTLATKMEQIMCRYVVGNVEVDIY